MSQPSLGDFQLPPQDRVGGPEWPPTAQRAVTCGIAAAILVIVLAFGLWMLMAVYVKLSPVFGTTPGSAPSKAAPPPKAPAQTPAAKPPKSAPTNAR